MITINNSNIDFNNIDCFEYMKNMPNSSIPLIVTDPPYGIDFSGFTSNTEWDHISDYKSYIINLLTEFNRILTDNGTIWLFCARTMIPTIFSAIEETGLQNNLENWCTYVRMKGRGSSLKLKSQCEEVLHITHKEAKWIFNPLEYLIRGVVPYIKDGKPRGWFKDADGEKCRWTGLGNAMCFTSPFFKCKFEKQIHSTQKPILMLIRLIMLSSKVGDTVFDPFVGSGSGVIASILSDRHFIGCEQDLDMFNKANDWINNLDWNLAKDYIQLHLKNKNP